MNKIPPSFDFSEDIVREVPVNYKGKEYILREPTVDAGRKMQNLLGQASVVNAQGNVIKVNNPGDLPSKFVSQCLFLKEDGKEKHVTENELNGWPARYIKQMMSQIMAWLEEQGETEETLTQKLRETEEKLTSLRSGEGTLEEESVKN